MLPITQQDVEKALDEIDTDGVPRKYLSRLYCLVARQDDFATLKWPLSMV